jgi:hypothetical protein
MTILNLAVGSDRVLLIQDSGSFSGEPPHRQTATVSKIAALPERRMLSAGCGSTGMLAKWRQALSVGCVGDCLAEVATYGPPLLRGLWRASDGPLIVIVAALDDDGRAGGLAMESARNFDAVRITRGRVVLLPDTAEPEPERSTEPAAEPKAEPTESVEPAQPDDAAPLDDDLADWTALRLRVIRGTRLQIEQRRVPFGPPFTEALLHAAGIDLRRFRP